MLAVSTYFFKWRTSAVGLMMAGASAGQALFNQLVSYSMQRFGFRGTVLIMAALSMHCVVMPFLYHPLCEHGIKKTASLGQEMKPLNADSAGSIDMQKTAEESRGIPLKSVMRLFNFCLYLIMLNEAERRYTIVPKKFCGKIHLCLCIHFCVFSLHNEISINN